MEKSANSSANSYNQILKTTAVFGSVKMFSVLIGLFRAKITAIFLGPAGMGIYNLLNYPITLVSQFSGLGISTSGIREVAQTNSEQQLRETAEVIKYWNRTTGVIGSLFLLLTAPWISQLSFGDNSYTWAFRILSVVVFFTALGGEYEVLLRGRRETKLVAKAGFFSSLAGFLASIPLFYFFGNTGIVIVILVTSITLVIVNYLYAKKLNIQPFKMPYRDIFQKGGEMVSLGFFIVLGDLIYVSVITVVNAFIRKIGGLEDVGLFQACMQITQASINVVLMAMAADYYPRLANCQSDTIRTSEIATQQTEIAILLCTPLVVSAVVFCPLVIRLLLSSSFSVLNKALCYFMLGTIFRLPSWAMNFVALANGKTKLYTLFVVINNTMLLPLYCLGYKFYGIDGIGISYIVLMICYSIIQNSIVKKELSVCFCKSFWPVFAIGSIISTLSIIVVFLNNTLIKLVMSALFLLLSICFCLYYLNKKTALSHWIKARF